MLCIKSGKEFFGPAPLAFWKVLSHVPPGLMIDVGAGAGVYTNYMAEASPESRIVSYEPFPGNHKYLIKATQHNPNIRLEFKAVGNRGCKAKFYVSEAVKTGNQTWSKYLGYSSVGFIVPNDYNGDTIDVECIRLDDIYDETIRLLKIDVQGFEFNVLDGASRLSSVHGIDLMFVEIVNEIELLALILGRGYQVYTQIYTILVRDNCDLSNWDIMHELTLSTGRRALQGWPKYTPSTVSDYDLWYKSESQRVGHFFTDLVCCSPGFQPQLNAAVEIYRGKSLRQDLDL
jgi:FkbM family methyltransferase